MLLAFSMVEGMLSVHFSVKLIASRMEAEYTKIVE